MVSLFFALVRIPYKRGNKYSYRQIAIGDISGKIFNIIVWMHNMKAYLLMIYSLVFKIIHPLLPALLFY